MSINFTINTLIKNCDSEDLNEKVEKCFDHNQFKIIDKKKQKSESTEEYTERELQKPLWFEMNKK